MAERPEGVLPSLAGVVPMKAKLGKRGSDFTGLLVGELNPDPTADNLGHVEESGRFIAKQGKQLLGGQCPVRLTSCEVDPRKLRKLRLLLRCWCRCLLLCGC